MADVSINYIRADEISATQIISLSERGDSENSGPVSGALRHGTCTFYVKICYETFCLLNKPQNPLLAHVFLVTAHLLAIRSTSPR